MCVCGLPQFFDNHAIKDLRFGFRSATMTTTLAEYLNNYIIILSFPGGRRLDTCAATIEMLPEVCVFNIFHDLAATTQQSIINLI